MHGQTRGFRGDRPQVLGPTTRRPRKDRLLDREAPDLKGGALAGAACRVRD